jgi:K+/H+ antiporter YhaU regulatory subunit KhtT
VTSVDSDLALHCLEDLGRKCPIVTQREELRTVSPACEGLSIRDTLFGFLVQTVEEMIKKKYEKEKHAVTLGKLIGQTEAFAYSVAIIDNPYRPDWRAVLEAARMEVDRG